MNEPSRIDIAVSRHCGYAAVFIGFIGERSILLALLYIFP